MDLHWHFVARLGRSDRQEWFSNPTYYALWELADVQSVSQEHNVWCGEYRVHTKAFSDVPWTLADGMFGRCYVIYWFSSADSRPTVRGMPDWMEQELDALEALPESRHRIPPLPDFSSD